MVRNPRPRPRPRPRPMASKKDVLYCPSCGEEIKAKKKR